MVVVVGEKSGTMTNLRMLLQNMCVSNKYVSASRDLRMLKAVLDTKNKKIQNCWQMEARDCVKMVFPLRLKNPCKLKTKLFDTSMGAHVLLLTLLVTDFE